MENALLSYTKEGKGGTFLVVWVPSEVILRSRTFEGQRKVAEMCRMQGDYVEK